MKRVLLCTAFLAGTIVAGSAQASTLDAVDAIKDQTLILGGKFALVTIETTYTNGRNALGKHSRQTILPVSEDGQVHPVSVRVQTVSGNYATLLFSKDTLTHQLQSAAESSNIVRFLEVDHQPIHISPLQGFRFSSSSFTLDTPWKEQDVQREGLVSMFSKAHPYRDVETGRWSEHVIYSLSADGIVHGVGEGYFDPEGAVSRAAFLKMLSGAVAVPQALNAPSIPKDVKQDASWAKDAVMQIKSAVDSSMPGAFDQIFGSGSLFRPNESITRAQAAEVLAFFVPVTATSTQTPWPFTDWPANEHVKPLIDQGVLSGTGANQFSPDDTLSREQMATIILRLRYIL